MKIMALIILSAFLFVQIRIASLFAIEFELPPMPKPLVAQFIFVDGHITDAIQKYGFTSNAIFYAIEDMGIKGGVLALPAATFTMDVIKK